MQDRGAGTCTSDGTGLITVAVAPGSSVLGPLEEQRNGWTPVKGMLETTVRSFGD